ncbi:MAG: CBS domain-containing protein [Leptospiraceae bacterium]|nr:CBS domain-containing protein [Leptospiraceae bacterium]MCP5512667.1 CBS domain-containing protein [Leptospiraceae bacterium]
MKVENLLSSKPANLITIGPEASVFDALEIMAEKNIGALLVTEGKKMIGILSERDYARKVILKGKASKDTRVKEIMTSEVISVSTDHIVEECMHIMSSKHIRHLPVLNDGELKGIISIGDVVKAIISEKEFTIKQLENYISGTG